MRYNEIKLPRIKSDINIDLLESKFGKIVIDGGISMNNKLFRECVKLVGVTDVGGALLLFRRIIDKKNNKTLSESVSKSELDKINFLFDRFEGSARRSNVSIGDTVYILNLEAMFASKMLTLYAHEEPKKIVDFDGDYVIFDDGDYYPKKRVSLVDSIQQTILYSNHNEYEQSKVLMMLLSDKWGSWELKVVEI